MSAVRRRENRAVNRSRQSLPYARPPSKKSLWSITGLLSYFNPMRSRSPADDAQPQPSLQSESEESSDTPSEEDTGPAETLTAREHELTRDLNVLGRPNAIAGSSAQPPTFTAPVTPTRPDPYYPLHETSSPSKNLETVAFFLTQRRGQPISEIEVEGLVSLIQKSTPPDKPEPFRFSSSTPSTPARGNTPFSNQNVNINFGFNTPSPTTNQTPTSSARKTLSKNPNGVYRWEGGGSAKPLRTRNRYQSPAFGPPRSTPERIVLKSQPGEGEVKMDTKRRRVGEDTGSSSASPSGIVNGNAMGPQPRSGAPAPSPTRAIQAFPFPVSSPSPSALPQTPPPAMNGTATTPKLGGVSPSMSTSRFRTTGLPPKPTVPAVPSPLRQTWGRSPSSSQTDIPTSIPSGQSQNSQHRQTKAANFMTELIKEVTPPKRPDVSNPYQTASPVGKVGGAKGRGKRVRATGKPAPPKVVNDEEKKDGTDGEKLDGQKAKKGNEKEYSPQAIIEATLPKGSKRSRPPAHFDNSTSAPAPAPAPAPSPYDRTPSPRQSPRDRQHNLPIDNHLKGNSRSPQVDMNENLDEDKEWPASKKAKPSVNGNDYRSGPANGRTSTSTNKAARQRVPAVVIEEVDDVDMSLADNPSVHRPVEQPAKLSPPIIPTNTNGSVFGSSTSSGGISPNSSTARPLFGSLKSSSAPKEPSKLRFSYQPEVGSSSPTPTPASHEPMMDAREDERQKVGQVKELKRKRVDPKDAAIAMAVDSLPTYVFTVTGTSALSTAAHIHARNTAISLPKSSLPSFDFSIQAGEKNTGTASNRTEPSAPVAPVKTFDWAAAGMKAPTSAGGGASWTCSTCMLSNPGSAIDKCTVCESPR